MEHTAGVHIDADGLTGHAARRAALVTDASDCVAELRDDGFGAWWRDGRPTGLETRLRDVADRLEHATAGLDGVTDGIRYQSAVLVAADQTAGYGLGNP